jgi:23S rRNA pseudouridine955/2504/2580 synthase
MKEKSNLFIAAANDDGKRIDRILRRLFPSLPLSAVYRCIRRGGVTINGTRTKIDDRVHTGDRIEIAIRMPPPVHSQKIETDSNERKRDRAFPQELILFQNEHVLAVNKPYGALVHGKGSLTDILNSSTLAAGSASLSFRPGPVHRLDRNTTGIQLFALSLFGARTLSRLFHERAVTKIYCGLVPGIIAGPLEWRDHITRDRVAKITIENPDKNTPIAVTSVLPIISTKTESLVFFLPQTGRTHQLRFQSALHGHPLLGDGKYGGVKSYPRYLLHNIGLAFTSQELPVPPFIAPFDHFEEELITLHFGKQAVETIYCRVGELLN